MSLGGGACTGNGGRCGLVTLLRPHESKQCEFFLLLLAFAVEWLGDDARELARHRFLRLQLLQEGVVVRIEDQHIFLRHLGEWVVRGDDLAQQLRMVAMIVRHYLLWLRRVHVEQFNFAALGSMVAPVRDV